MTSPSKGSRSARRSSLRLSPRSRAALFATFSMASLFAGQSAQAVNTEKDVLGTAMDLTLAASYNPATAPVATNDITFLAATTYTNAAALTLSGSISIGTLNDLNATALTITGSTTTARTITLNGGGDTVAGSNAADLIFVADGGSLTFRNGSSVSGTVTTTLGLSVALAANGNFNVGTGSSLTFGSGLSGNFNLTKTGAGTMTLGAQTSFGSATKTFTLAAGTLNINAAGSLGANGNTFAINGGTINNTSGAAVVLNSIANVTTVYPITIGGDFAFGTSAGTTANNLNLSSSGISIATDRTITLNGAGVLTLGGLLTNTADSVRTLTVNGGASDNGAGTLVINGYALTGTGSTAARNDVINGSGNVTINGAVRNGVSAGSGLTYSGTGILTLSGANTYTGPTTVTNGQVIVGVTSVAGVSGALGLNSDVVLSGGLLSIGGFATQIGTLSDGGSNAGTLFLGNGALTMVGNGSTTFSGTIDQSGTGALIKGGLGTLTLSGTNTFVGGTTVNAGALTLDYSTQNTNKLSDTGALTLGGATVNLVGGTYTEVVGSTTINAGGSVITQSAGGGSTLQMGTITRAAANGGTISFSAPGIATTTTANTNGILGGYAVVLGAGGTADWATGAATAGAVTAINAYVPYTPFVATGGTATANYLLTDSGATTAIETFNTLKIASTQAGQELAITTATTGLTLNSGLLYQGANAYTISGGMLRGSAGTGELIVEQYGTGNLTISSVIAAGAVTKSGPGTLTLSGVNTYTGTTFVSQGTLVAGIGGAPATGGSVFGTTGTMVINNGATLDVSQVTTPLTVGSLASNATFGTGAFVNLGATTLGIGNAGTTTTTFAGAISGTGGIEKTGTSVQVFSGANTYTGVTRITGGTLTANNLTNVNTASSLGVGTGSAADLVFNGGTLQYAGATAPATTNRLFTLAGNGTIDASGTASAYTVGFTSTGAVAVGAVGPHVLTLTGTNGGTGGNGLDFTFNNTLAPQLVDGAGGVTSLAKTGTGTWLVTGTANTYSGGTVISAGRLVEVSSGTAGTGTGSLGTGLVTVANGNSQLVLQGAGNFAAPLSLVGNGPNFGSGSVSGNFGALVLNNGANQTGTVTLTGVAGAGATAIGATRISAAPVFLPNTATGTISGQSTGTGGLDYGAGSQVAGGALTVANASTTNLNNYTGNTSISGGGSGSGSNVTVRLGASEQIPNGVLAGNLVLNGANATSTNGAVTLSLNGFNETINGLATIGANTPKTINNGGTANSMLTLGDGDATASFGGASVGTLSNGGGTGTLAVTKIGSGTQTLASAAVNTATTSTETYTGGTTVNAGTLRLDFSQFTTAAAAFNVLAPATATSVMRLGGGTLAVLGNASTTGTSAQTLVGTTVNPGASGINVNANGGLGTVLNLAAITRNVGGTVDLTLPTGTQGATNGVTTTSTSVSNGVLTSAAGTAYATVGGTDWASIPTTGTARSITALAAYNANSFTTADNSDVSGAQAPGSSFTVNTLRFNAAGGSLDVSGGAATVSTGGILVTAATGGAAGNAATIGSTAGGGFLRAGAGAELVVVNNGALVVSAPVVNGTAGASALTISGVGTTTFTGANTFSGPATLNGGTYTPGLVYTGAAGGTAALPAGTVFVNNGLGAGAGTGLGTGALVVNQNATLAGNGTLGNSATTFAGGSTVAPGATAGGIGVLSLTSGTVTFAGGSGSLATYAANVAADGTSDLLRIVGNLDLSGAFDQIVVTGVTGAGSYQLATFTGTLTGSFDAVSVPTNYQLAYVAAMGATPGSINLVTTIPEPGTWAVLLVGLTGAAGWSYAARRRQTVEAETAA